MIVHEHFRRTIRDTPCARCGHAHAGPDHWNGLERCGEWMSEWNLSGAGFWMCDCPEWVQPVLYRCEGCGRPSLRPFKRWLGGRRACSVECAAGVRSAA